jgi:hypothetical protein
MPKRLPPPARDARAAATNVARRETEFISVATRHRYVEPEYPTLAADRRDQQRQPAAIDGLAVRL